MIPIWQQQFVWLGINLWLWLRIRHEHTRIKWIRTRIPNMQPRIYVNIKVNEWCGSKDNKWVKGFLKLWANKCQNKCLPESILMISPFNYNSPPPPPPPPSTDNTRTPYIIHSWDSHSKASPYRNQTHVAPPLQARAPSNIKFQLNVYVVLYLTNVV